MFDLKENISGWKNSFKNKESFTKENIDELENHLTEHIEKLLILGLSEEESFWIAQKRIGSAELLNTEYEKVNMLDILRKRIYWMLFGVSTFALVLYMFSSITYFSYALISITDIKLVTLTYLIYTIQEILFLLPVFLITRLMFSRKIGFLEKIVIRFVLGISGKTIWIISFIILLLGLITNFLLLPGSQSINLAISHAEGFHEYLQITKTVSPAIMLFNTMLMMIAFYFSYKKTYRAVKLIK